MRILILGGTGFTGTFQVRHALSRGHAVTVFNRAKTHPGALPKGVTHLLGDRNGQLDALQQGGPWDAVIDNPTTLPAWVRDAARILQGRAGQYVFISTISVYADHSRPGQDESGAVGGCGFPGVAERRGVDGCARLGSARWSDGWLYASG